MNARSMAVVLLLVAAVAAGAQDWVDSYGTDTVYQPPRYISGYGVSDLSDADERLEAARNAALSQLSRQIRVQITSDESIRTTDYGDGERTSYTNTIQTASELRISGAEFEVSSGWGKTHVLAWIEISDLREQFADEQEDARDRVRTLIRRFDDSIERGDLEQAERDLVEIDTAFSALTDATAVVRALDRLAGRSGSMAVNPVSIQEELEERRGRLRAFEPRDPQEAAEYLARLLAPDVEDVARVTPLLYEDQDFSSAFGSRFSGLVEAALAQAMGGGSGRNTVVLRGSYWPEDESVEVHLVARDVETGRTVAAAQTSVPVSSVDEEDLRPANMDQALAGGATLLNDQVVNGGLDLEVWTDKGRDERALVFEEGELIQFYFRVNQPAFLRLSYVLASGETVLLEDQFYIGIDRVNRVVALPYRFRVVPPFGVERLIVTGHTSPPPPADVVIRMIDGQNYEVFRSMEDTVVRTRGLVREAPPEGGDEVRVAESSLSITTVAGSW